MPLKSRSCVPLVLLMWLTLVPAARQAWAAETTAEQKQLAEQAWTARQAAAQAEAAVAEAKKTLSAKSAPLKTAREKLSTARSAADTAAAKKKAAQKAFDAAGDAERGEAETALQKQTAAAQDAAAKAAAAQQAVDLAESEKVVAEQVVAEKESRHRAAQDAAAVAHAQALGGLRPIASEQWDYSQAQRLLFLAGFGGPPEEVQRLVAMGPHKAVDYLVEYRERPAMNLVFNCLPWERPLAYEQRLPGEALNRLAEQDERRDATQHAALIDWWAQTITETPRPLEEKLVLFWHDHFASSYLTLRDAHALYHQNQFFRRYADNFEALLHGIVQDPAMIRYLNNDENVAGQHNENLGRELLELFSLGEEHSAAHQSGGYSEQDVRDANTRALTGATYERYSGQFRFYASRHDDGPKTLLGRTGAWGPHEAVDIMLAHPATARYLCKKLWQYFTGREPAEEVVERLAHVLRENGYQLRPVLKNMFLSEQFRRDAALNSHIKSPIELLVGTVKIAKLPNPNYKQWRHVLSNMGQALFDPPSVAGWPEGRHWINANLLLVRYTATADLVKQGKADYVALHKGRQFTDAAAVVDHFTQRFLTTGLSADKRQAMIELLGSLPPSSQWEQQKEQVNALLRALVVLLVSSPEYQVS